MLTGILLNSCFWAGIGMLLARSFQDALSRLLATLVVGFATLVICLQLLSLFRAIQLIPVALICGFALILGLVVLSRARTLPLGQKPGTSESSANSADRLNVRIMSLCGVLIVGFASWAALDCLIYGLFTPVLVDSDAPIYHLPFAIHWAKVGKLDFVSTPFGEEGAPYFPADGDLWLAWLALTFRGAAAIKVGQWPFLAIGGMALYGTARLTGASRGAAASVSGIWCSLPPALRQASVANVDLIWTAFYFIALFFVMRFHTEAPRGVPARRNVWLAALSLGIVLGTKSVGLVYAPLLIGPLIWLIWRNSRIAGCGSTISPAENTPSTPSKRRDTRRSLPFFIGGVGLLFAGIVLPSAFWFGRNLWITGNPLYPLDFSWFGRSVLTGWYDTSAMRNTAYHIPVDDWRVLVTRLSFTAGPWLASLWFMGIVSGLLARNWTVEKRGSGHVVLLSFLAVLQLLIYWFVLPYNTQERFLLPALGIGLVPLSRALTARPGFVWLVGLLFLGHVFLAFYGAGTAMDDVSFRTLRTLLDLGAGWRGAAFVASLVVAGALAQDRRWFSRALASAALLTGCSLYAAPLASFARQDPGRSFYPETGFGTRMLPAWHIVERASRPEGARIAYAGGNLPYYLLGPNHRNDAIYVNINRHRNWLPHDYHQARRRAGQPDTATIPWPQWYREEADYEAWLENLRAARIDFFFVSRTNLHGRPPTPDGGLPPFPIEKTWADAHSEEFEFLGPQSPEEDLSWARVYRLRERAMATP
jgi:hypothetical protein